MSARSHHKKRHPLEPALPVYTNAEILERWRSAIQAHADAAPDTKPQALFAIMVAEQMAIDRFGVDLHRQAYRALFRE